MRSNINIQANDQVFPYVIEYTKDAKLVNGNDIDWCNDNGVIRLFDNDTEYYRHGNDWYHADTLDMTHTHIPASVHVSNIKVYLPTHAISTYYKGIRYAVTANTWINGHKIDLGTFVFRPSDTSAITTGPIKSGNNEYFECIDFVIVDPFSLTYSDDWIQFRNKVCNEPLNLNGTGSPLQVSLFVVDEYDNRLMIKDGCTGGVTNFTISTGDDFLGLRLFESLDPLGFRADLVMNSEYDWFLSYLNETYGLTNVSMSDIKLELAIKNKFNIIPGPVFSFAPKSSFGISSQDVPWTSIDNSNGFKVFFDSWETFEPGWNVVASVTVYDAYGDEVVVVVSNEIPITQELFSRYTNDGAEKIIDITPDMFTTYNVVNKIETNVIQIERPNESKSNITQPVFFRVKDLETLTLHPVVTENISINLDDYKSKVSKFILQIEGCKFEQIGANSYGILFKIPGNTIPANAIAGTYYILNENMELVTTGKYTCIR